MADILSIKVNSAYGPINIRMRSSHDVSCDTFAEKPISVDGHSYHFDKQFILSEKVNEWWCGEGVINCVSKPFVTTDEVRLKINKALRDSIIAALTEDVIKKCDILKAKNRLSEAKGQKKYLQNKYKADIAATKNRIKEAQDDLAMLRK